MENAYTRHHFVPVTYLKQFNDVTTSQDKMIWMQKINSPYNTYPKCVSASSVCYRDHYYKLDKDRIVEKYKLSSSLYIEIEGFKKYENAYDKNIQKLIANEVEVDFNEARIFLKGLILLKLRNPYVKEVVFNKPEIEDSAQQAIDFLIRKNRLNENSASFEKFLRAAEKLNKEVRDKSNHKSIYLELLLDDIKGKNKLSETFIDILMRSNWIVLKTRNGKEFTTCDNPGFCIDKKSNKVYNIKIDGQVGFFIPLTPYYYLCISTDSPDLNGNHKSKKILYKDAEDQLISYLNNNTKAVAMNEIYSNTKSTVANQNLKNR